MKELVAAGEPGVALENYCAQLFEYDVAVPTEVVAELEGLGRAMGINKKCWMRLRK
jgi:rRNA-processing protein FCF1